MHKLSVATCVAGAILFLGQTPQNTLHNVLNQKLDELSRIGITHRFLDENTIELRDTLAGWTRVKTLKEPDEAAIRGWASTRGIPVIDIDPTLVDTSEWTGWYNYWTYVFVSNGDRRVPTQAFDFDSNGFPEVYGAFGGVGFPAESRVFEVYPDGSSAQRHIYPVAGLSTQVLDVDGNGLPDLVFNTGQFVRVYEQPSSGSLPTQLKCVFNKYNGLAGYLSIEPMADMDGDSVMDFVHRGADTTVSQYYLMYVSEYNSSIQNFEKTWSIEPPIPPTGFDFMDGYDMGDYDGDGRMEIISSSLRGKIRVVENTGNNAYAVTFEDSLPLVNMYYQSSGDIDNDGKREFFVGATMGSGNWTVMYEADSNNHFSPRILLHLLSGGSLDDPTYFCRDVNGDGQLELVILSGGWLYVFKSDANDSYYLWYLRQGPSSFTVNFHDMDGDGIQDILWSSIRESRWATDIFKGSPLVSVGPEAPGLPERAELLQNYPNPFNPNTRIVYRVRSRESVSLKVYDMLGREVQTLVNEAKTPGEYQVTWDARGFASGIYIYRMQTTAASISKKMLLVR